MPWAITIGTVRLACCSVGVVAPTPAKMTSGPSAINSPASLRRCAASPRLQLLQARGGTAHSFLNWVTDERCHRIFHPGIRSARESIGVFERARAASVARRGAAGFQGAYRVERRPVGLIPA